MIKIFIGELLPKIPHTEILFPNLGNGERENPFGEKIFASFTKPLVEIVEKPELADYLCIPHNYNYIKNKSEYLASFEALAGSYSKKILIFFPGDSDAEVPLRNSIVFRNSQYKASQRPNEVVIPGYAAHLGEKYGIHLRSKAEKATTGFCGWATPSSFRGWIAFILAHVKPTPRTQGLYFRIKALNVLKKSRDIISHFIIRSSYSGSAKTLRVDPLEARKDYVENIQNSDFTLSPKGDGNFSIRFFETLSLGRIPLLIDTDCPLPLENEIAYDDFILRVSYKDIKNLPSIVANFYSSLSQEEFEGKQKKCLEAFEKYLKIDAFFAHVLREDFLNKIAYTKSN